MNCRMSSFVTILDALAVSLTMSLQGVRAETPLKFGWSSVAPHTADYDGDGRMEMGLYDSTKGTMYARTINGTELAFDATIALPGFIAACADFDGDRKTDPASYDLASGVLYVFLSTGGYQLGSLPCAVGASTTKAVPADYDGDGKADPALYDSSLGLWVMYPSGSGYQPVSGIFGGNGMTAVPMDYDNDGKADLAVYDENSGQWWVICSASQYALSMAALGGPGCVAAPGDFDGDGKADPAVYYAPLGVWGTLNSANNYELSVREQGGPGYVPVPGNYYFANRADYAVYNTANGCWYINYDLGGLYTMLGTKFLKALVTGAGRQTGKDITGWSMDKIFHHNADPTDPHWAEEQETLNAMNAKLDTLLDGQVAIQNQISNLAAQLQYNMSKVTLLIDGGAAKEACSTIRTHYDQNNMDSYRAFYQCDTNNLPPNNAVMTFAANVRGTWDIENKITTINSAIMPSATSEGVLWDWAALATNNLTPDNLYGNFAALANYYGNLYMYQMKAVSMYVDACRVADTSEWAQAHTAYYITNDVVNMIQEEVDLFRTVTYTYVMTAVNAAYDPVSTNNPLEIAGVADTLAALEFFSQMWLGQTNGLCATFLTVDRPSVIAKYGGMLASQRGVQGYTAQKTVVTNQMAGHAYGYLSPDLKHLVATNGYVFLRNDFGQVPLGTYDLSNSFGYFGMVTVSNYDDNMQLTSDPSVTNWFGHLYASPYNIERLELPIADASQWSMWTPSYYHSEDPYNNTHNTDYWPTSLINFSLGMHLEYNWMHGYHLPTGFGGLNITYATYPLQVINNVPGGVKVRIDFCADNTAVIFNYYADDTRSQYYSFSYSGGRAALTQPSSTNIYTWLTESGRYQEPKAEWGVRDNHSWTNASQKGMLNAALEAFAAQTAAVSFAIGSSVQPWLDTYMGRPGDHVDVTLLNQVSYSVRYVILSFY